MQTELRTFVDAVDHLMDQFGTDSTDSRTLRKMKRSVENAYRDIASVRNWLNYYQRQTLILTASYTTGTIAYDHTGGTYERMVTLTGGTWPSDAALSTIRINNHDYDVATRESSTVITLGVNSNPGADVASSTTYTMYRDTYPLPVDFRSIGTIRDVDRQLYPQLIKPDDFVAYRIAYQMPTQPRYCCIMADQNYMSQMALKLYPPPDQAYFYEYMYYRQPRTLKTYQYNTGTVAVSGVTVTGTGTAWTTDHIGSVIRFSGSTTAPTGTVGSNPFAEQRVITDWTSATVVTLDQAPSGTYSGTAYEISDPIDIESTAMYTAFIRRCELEFAQTMNRDDTDRFMKQYRSAEITAMESDDRYFAERPHGARSYRRLPVTWETRNAT